MKNFSDSSITFEEIEQCFKKYTVTPEMKKLGDDIQKAMSKVGPEAKGAAAAMLDFSRLVSSFQCHELKPIKAFGHKYYPRKGKYGPKSQRVTYFSHWQDMIEDGQILRHNDKLFMNTKTLNNVNQQTKWDHL